MHIQDAQLQAQAQERDFDELVKKQEKERRIQQQFQQEQCDRRTENLRGKSFIDKGNGVNPFFVIQRERAAASTSSKSEVCTVDSTYCSGVAVTAESAFWDFMVRVSSPRISNCNTEEPTDVVQFPKSQLQYLSSGCFS